MRSLTFAVDFFLLFCFSPFALDTCGATDKKALRQVVFDLHLEILGEVFFGLLLLSCNDYIRPGIINL